MEDLVLEEFSGSRCKEHVEALVKLPRYSGSSGYHKAVLYLTERLKEIGVADHC